MGEGVSDCCAAHELKIEVCDQTLGLACTECNDIVRVCWGDEHIPESMWNRACENDADGVPCAESRVDVCALCGESIEVSGDG